MHRAAGTTEPRRAGAAQVAQVAQVAAYYAILAVFGLGCLTWNPVARVLLHVLPRRLGQRVGQLMIRAGFRALLALTRGAGLLHLDLSALDALRDDASLVVTPNHPFLLDAVLVISRLPRVVCIIKPSIWDNPFLGGGARLAGYIRNDAPHVVIRRAARAIAEGNQLLIFPEGTRTVREPVNAFRGGFAVMARRAGAPVQTVFIAGSSAFLRKSWPGFRRPAFPISYRASLGRRFVPTPDTSAFVAELEAYYRRELGPLA